MTVAPDLASKAVASHVPPGLDRGLAAALKAEGRALSGLGAGPPLTIAGVEHGLDL